MNHFKKKSKKLEKLRGIFFQIGLIIAGGLTLMAFEWMTPVYKVELPKPPEISEPPIELPPITYTTVPDKPMVKITQPSINTDIIEIIIEEPTTGEEPIVNSEPDDDYIFVPFTEEGGDPIEDEDVPFTIVEDMPEFIGGEKELLRFLQKNVTYPKDAIGLGISGTVYVNFVISKKGKIKKINILRGVNKLLDREAIRVVKMMPDWKPGKQRGKTVEVSYNLPINFTLR